ncbi:MAG: hypothetical protein ABSE45_09855 [Candidatus Acidiferrales bacterium]|jgi:hypothetical protein
MVEPSNVDTEAVRTLATVFGVIFAVITTLNASLRRAKTAEAKEKVISAAFGWAGAAFPLLGLLASWFFGAERAGLGFFVLGALIVSMDYLRKPAPATRWETFELLLILCVTFSLVDLFFLGKLLGMIEQIVGVLGKLNR